MTIPTLHYLKTLTLRHTGDCYLLGVMPTQGIYAEEIYDDESWMAQHYLNFDGELLISSDEDAGRTGDVRPIPLPPNVVKPQRGWHMMSLNFQGPRHRGMRGQERVGEMVRPISVATKMQLVGKLALDVPLPMILGVVESYVIAEAELVRPVIYVVCRRVRIAYALPEQQIDSDHNPYDYDTVVMHVGHLQHRDHDQPPPVDTVLSPFHGVALNRPMDCVIADDHLYIADGGTAPDRLSAIHVWRIEQGE